MLPSSKLVYYSISVSKHTVTILELLKQPTYRDRVNFINSVLIDEAEDVSVMPGLICVYCLWKSYFYNRAGLRAKTLVRVSTFCRGFKVSSVIQITPCGAIQDNISPKLCSQTSLFDLVQNSYVVASRLTQSGTIIKYLCT